MGKKKIKSYYLNKRLINRRIDFSLVQVYFALFILRVWLYCFLKKMLARSSTPLLTLACALLVLPALLLPPSSAPLALGAPVDAGTNNGCPAGTKAYRRVCVCPATAPVCKGSLCMAGYAAADHSHIEGFRKVGPAVMTLLFSV